MPATDTKNRIKTDPDDDTMDPPPPIITGRNGVELSVNPTVANNSSNDEARGVTPSPTLVASASLQGFGGDDDDDIVPSPVVSSAAPHIKAEASNDDDVVVPAPVVSSAAQRMKVEAANDDDDDDDDIEIVGVQQAAGHPIPSPVASAATAAAATSSSNEAAAQELARAREQARLEARAAAVAAAIQQRKEVKAKERADQLELDDFFDVHTREKFAGLAPYQRPDGFKPSVNLFDYQQDGVRWLVHQEENESERISPFWKKQKSMLGNDTERWNCRMGGIRQSQTERPTPDRGSLLADDMGLGKSIQTLGLILSCMPPQDDKSAPRVTLIVCPVSVMASWQLQIDRFVAEGYLNVVEYHGPHRHKVLTRMSRKKDVDILLSSYDTLNSDFKQFQLDNEEEDEEEEKKARGKKANKKARKSAWTSSAKDSEEDWSLGSESEDEDDHHLSKSTLSNKKRAPSIFSFDFHRVILDEAHRIRNGKTVSFKACSALVADRRLTISGTPFVNHPSDLHSLLAFLAAGTPSTNPLIPKKNFDALVVQPIKESNMLGLSRCRAMMSHIGLRRTKQMVNMAELGIPSKTLMTVTVPFAEGFHKETHDVLYETAREVFMNMLAGGGKTFFSCFYQFFSLVLRVRQCCDHAAMVPAVTISKAREALEIIADNGGQGELKLDADEAREILFKLMEVLKVSSEVDELSLECSICLDQYDEETAVCLRGCAHVFCEGCISDLQGEKVCPLCRANFKNSDKISVEACKAAIKKQQQKEKRKKAAEKTTDWDGEEQAPKIVAMLEQIELMAADEKGVIFSQFTEYLNLIEMALDEAGYTYTRIDGSVTHSDRLEAMKALDAEDGPRFMLVSIRAAGEGLTLVRANVCFLMDPWWNAAVQDQAADRVHRIGQTRPVKVFQFVMKDSVEERMLALQEAKTALGNGSLRKLTKEEAKKARITAMKDLFQISKAAQWSGRFDEDEEEGNDDGSDLEGFIVDDDDFE